MMPKSVTNASRNYPDPKGRFLAVTSTIYIPCNSFLSSLVFSPSRPWFIPTSSILNRCYELPGILIKKGPSSYWPSKTGEAAQIRRHILLVHISFFFSNVVERYNKEGKYTENSDVSETATYPQLFQSAKHDIKTGFSYPQPHYFHDQITRSQCLIVQLLVSTKKVNYWNQVQA
jgi:hypothetical protein